MAAIDVLKLRALEQEADAEAKLALEYSIRTWKASEIQRLREKVRQSGGDPEERLGMGLGLGEIERQAKAEGRFVDDLSPTFANLRARLGAGAWVYPGSNMPMLREWATWADRTSPRKLSPTASPGSQPERYRTAVGTFNRMLLGGHISNEIAFGVLYAEALPEWWPTHNMLPMESEGVPGSVRVSRIVPRGDAEARPEFVAAQADRWLAFEDSARTICNLIFEGAKLVDDLPTFLPGFVWLAWPTGEAPAPGLVSFNTDTRAARRWLANGAAAAIAAERARAIAAVEGADGFRARLAAGADPATDPTIRANNWKAPR